MVQELSLNKILLIFGKNKNNNGVITQVSKQCCLHYIY
jgi:hypothetical protein